MKIQHTEPAALARRAFFLAYIACGGPLGWGILQAREGVTEDQVWRNVVTNGDYAYQPRPNSDVNAYGDYVFGRMMKLSIKVETDGVTFPDAKPRSDYQAWCVEYPTYEALIEAARASLEQSGNEV